MSCISTFKHYELFQKHCIEIQVFFFFILVSSLQPKLAVVIEMLEPVGGCPCLSLSWEHSSTLLFPSMHPASPEKHLYSASSLMSVAQASTCFVRNELLLIKNQQKWACNTLCPINILTSSSRVIKAPLIFSSLAQHPQPVNKLHQKSTGVFPCQGCNIMINRHHPS